MSRFRVVILDTHADDFALVNETVDRLTAVGVAALLQRHDKAEDILGMTTSDKESPDAP